MYKGFLTKRLIYIKLVKRMKESNRNVLNEKVKIRTILLTCYLVI